MHRYKGWIWFLFAIFIIASGVSMMVHVAEVGVEPWTAAHVGLASRALTIGLWTSLIQALFIFITYTIEKRPPKVGTFLSMLLTGPLIDLFLHLYPFPLFETFGSKLLFFLLGLIVANTGAGLLIALNLGPGAKTQFYVAVSEATNIGIGTAKLLMEALGLFIAVLFSGPIFIGTVLFALFSGYVVQGTVGLWKKIIGR